MCADVRNTDGANHDTRFYHHESQKRRSRCCRHLLSPLQRHPTHGGLSHEYDAAVHEAMPDAQAVRYHRAGRPCTHSPPPMVARPAPEHPASLTADRRHPEQMLLLSNELHDGLHDGVPVLHEQRDGRNAESSNGQDDAADDAAHDGYSHAGDKGP